MAEVYRALRPIEHPRGSPGLCAIKRIRPELVDHKDARRMFADEARLMALLDHPNIVRSHGWGEVANVPYLAMELLEGLTVAKVWRAIARAKERFPIELAAYIVREMAVGLDYAHAVRDERGRPLNLIHRDVSPSNVMLLKSGEVKLIDFGVAKSAHRLREQWTRADVVKGKVCYMSPEQLRSQALDGRSDLFALGVTLWELLAGRHLFHQASPKEAAAMVLGGEIPALETVREDVPVGLGRVMIGALNRDRDRRFPTGADVAEALAPFCPPRSQAAHAIALLVHASRGLGARTRTAEALSTVNRRRTPGSAPPAPVEVASSDSKSIGSAPTTPRTLSHRPPPPLPTRAPYARPIRRPLLRHAVQIVVLALLSFGAGVLWQKRVASSKHSTIAPARAVAPLSTTSAEPYPPSPPPWHPTGHR